MDGWGEVGGRDDDDDDDDRWTGFLELVLDLV